MVQCSVVPQTSNKIIQKGLVFLCKQSGTVAVPSAERRYGILPRRLDGRGGASVVRCDAAMNRTEDSHAKVCKEARA